MFALEYDDDDDDDDDVVVVVVAVVASCECLGAPSIVSDVIL